MENIFTNYKHEIRFQTIRSKLNTNERFDPKLLSCAFIISGNQNLYKKFAKQFINQKFNFSLCRESESHTLSKLINHLLHDSPTITPNELAALKEDNLDLALNAIKFKEKGISKDYPLFTE